MSEARTMPKARCVLCASEAVSVFWKASALPVYCNVLCKSREQARRVPRGDIRLAFCEGCGLITNLVFEPERVTYDADYENSLHFSSRFREYADALAARLVDRYALRDKIVLEIGCGKGDFLRTLCALGNNRGIGFDPSYAPDGVDRDATQRLRFVRAPYSGHHPDSRADLICCRHTLEHIADPAAFLRTVRRGIGDRTDVVVFFEVPNALYTLRELGIWDLIYEHCTYFVRGALNRCFELSGFDVLKVTEEFGGQFLSIEARPGDEGGRVSPVRNDDHRQVAHDVQTFAAKYRSKLDAWRSRLDEMRRRGQRAVVWGAGSKGVTFLNILRPDDLIEYVVDMNPRKQGMYVAGTGQEIVSPEFLAEYQPDSVVVTNPVYADEIRASLSTMGTPAKVLLA